MSLRVLLDATAVPADRGGVGRYVDALVPSLVREGVHLVVVAQRRDLALFSTLGATEVVAAPGLTAGRAARLAWEQASLPALVRRLRAQVLHSPHYTAPHRAPAPITVTLHDATFFSHPEVHTRTKGHFFRAATRTAVDRAASLVVPSAATRDAVVRHTGGDPGKFHVAYHGVDRSLFRPVDDDERDRVVTSLDLRSARYVGFLGTLEPRKNVPALVRAWSQVAMGLAEPPALVLAGGPGWDPGVEPAIAAVPRRLEIVRTGYLPLMDLAGFLSGAEVLAYPSLGEGFGLPVLEAMACGAAVLTTRELSLPEVGGDAVAYCGTDEPSIARGLAQLLGDPVRRAALARAAQERSALFTWQASARAHVDAYEAALRRTA